ncbi:hypothetical protein DFAR_3060041 [Desulfarculales bacterium]
MHNFKDHNGVIHAPAKLNRIAVWQATRCVVSIQTTWRRTHASVTCPWCLAGIAKDSL